jgi:hypothetical protein
MGVDHSGGDIGVPQQVLNGPDVGSALKQVGGEGMTEGVRADLLGQPGAANRRLDGLVDNAGINVVATGDAGTRVNREIAGREDVLPAPLRGGRVFPSQRMGEIHLAMPLSQVLLIERLDSSQMVLEQRRKGAGKRREPVFITLAGTDRDLLHLHVDVLDPEPDRFHDPQAASIEELGNQLGGSVHEREHGTDFVACHDHGNRDLLVGTNSIDAAVQSLVQDALVKKHEGIHRLILSSGSDVAPHRQVRQERFDLRFRGNQVLA